MTHFTIDTDALATLVAPVDLPSLTASLNHSMLDMLEMWAEREWQKKKAGQPSEWDQHTWMTVAGAERTGTACGTTCCLAGKAVMVTPGVSFAKSGYAQVSGSWELTPVTDYSTLEVGTGLDNALVPAALVPQSEYDTYQWPDQQQNGQKYYMMDVSSAARIILGLNTREAGVLFAGNNDLEQVKTILTAIRAGEYRNTRQGRQDVPVSYVQVTTSPLCGKLAQDYVVEIVGTTAAQNLYRLYGKCVNLAGHAEGAHTFEDA